MIRSMIVLAQPLMKVKDDDDEEYVGVCKDKEEMSKRWDEYKRLRVVLNSLGFVDVGSKGEMNFDCEAMNWDGKMVGDLLEISPANIQLLEGKAKELAEARARALEKLTLEDQYALGLLKQP